MMLFQVVSEFQVFWDIFKLFICHCWGGLREQNMYKKFSFFFFFSSDEYDVLLFLLLFKLSCSISGIDLASFIMPQSSFLLHHYEKSFIKSSAAGLLNKITIITIIIRFKWHTKLGTWCSTLQDNVEHQWRHDPELRKNLEIANIRKKQRRLEGCFVFCCRAWFGESVSVVFSWNMKCVFEHQCHKTLNLILLETKSLRSPQVPIFMVQF